MERPFTILPTADGSRTLWSDAYQQTLHSHHGAMAESRHVYLELSGVLDRLRAQQNTVVLEIGFGAGLNALTTLIAAAEAEAPVTFLAAENAPLPADVLWQLGYVQALAPQWEAPWLELADALHHSPPNTLFRTTMGRACAEIQVWVGDAAAAPWPAACAHAVYLDAFSPDLNPELWTPAFFRALHAWSTADAVLTTYSCKGSVRRGLIEAGWSAQRAPGPVDGKRQVVRAEKLSAANAMRGSI